MPFVEDVLNRGDDGIECREVPVMSGHPTCKFPDTLDGVQLGTVRWHKCQRHGIPVLFPPYEMQFGMMIPDVVENQHDVTARMATGTTNLLEEREEGFAIKAIFLPVIDKLAIPDSYGPKIADSFTCWMVQKNRVRHFRWHPHPTGRAVLFKSDLV